MRRADRPRCYSYSFAKFHHLGDSWQPTGGDARYSTITLDSGGVLPRKLDESRRLQKRAEKLMPGGVSSPVRAFKAVECEAPFLARGQGSHVWDVDGNEYIDYIGSWGPLILGHADQGVLDGIL